MARYIKASQKILSVPLLNTPNIQTRYIESWRKYEYNKFKWRHKNLDFELTQPISKSIFEACGLGTILVLAWKFSLINYESKKNEEFDHIFTKKSNIFDKNSFFSCFMSFNRNQLFNVENCMNKSTEKSLWKAGLHLMQCQDVMVAEELLAQGESHEQNNKWKNALKCYRMASRCGSSEAAFKLGCMFEKGLGVSVNYEQAVMYFQIASDRGHRMANIRLTWLEGRIHKNSDVTDDQNSDKYVLLS